MTTAIQSTMLDRPVFTSGEVSETTYRQYDTAYTVFNDLLKDRNSYARGIWHEAQRFDTLTDAYTEHAAWVAPLARWEEALLAPVEGEPLAPDMEAALRQAELLGATADQRAKLRAIVTARFDAVQALAAMTERVQAVTVRAQRAETAATENITDPSDRRVWGIFGDAAKESKKQGYCSVYDQISEAVGIPTRDTLEGAGYMQPNRYDVEIEVTLTRRITVTVEADNYDAAIRAGDDMSHSDIWDYLDGTEWSHYDISDTDAKDASEVDE